MIHKMALISVLDFAPYRNFPKDCFTYYCSRLTKAVDMGLYAYLDHVYTLNHKIGESKSYRITVLIEMFNTLQLTIVVFSLPSQIVN